MIVRSKTLLRTTKVKVWKSHDRIGHERTVYKKGLPMFNLIITSHCIGLSFVAFLKDFRFCNLAASSDVYHGSWMFLLRHVNFDLFTIFWKLKFSIFLIYISYILISRHCVSWMFLTSEKMVGAWTMILDLSDRGVTEEVKLYFLQESLTVSFLLPRELPMAWKWNFCFHHLRKNQRLHLTKEDVTLVWREIGI